MPTSSSPSPTPQAIAQDAFVLLPLGPQTDELSTDRFIARHTASPHPLAGPVGRVRLPDVEAEREEILAWFEARLSTAFVAYVDGVPVGSGGCWYAGTCTYLSGSGVLEEFRGRGVYRALVRARWDDTVVRGHPALVIQAGRMSKPILERLGFETVCEVRAFIDHVPSR